MSIDYDIADQTFYTVFELGGIQYLPHYNETTFVAPGYGRHHFVTYTMHELVSAGAKRGVGYLLMRSKHQPLQ